MPFNIRNNLAIDRKRLDEINSFLLDPNNKLIDDFIEIVEKYGGPETINQKASEAGKVENLIARLKEKNSPYVKDLEWLIEQKNKESFITVDDYRKKILGNKAKQIDFNDDFAVTLEISACQYFPFFMKEARQAVEKGELTP